MESSPQTIAFPEMFQSLSTMKDAPTFVTLPSISSARLIIGSTTNRAKAFTSAAHWMEARPGNHRILRQPNSQINTTLRVKTSHTPLQIGDAAPTQANH